MTGDGRLQRLFDDLEQQAEGLALSERDAELAEQRRSEYAQVDLASRLHGSTRARLVLTVQGVGAVEGDLARVADDWLLLLSGSQEWLVRLGAVCAVRGLTEQARLSQARPLTARLGLGSGLRALQDSGGEVIVHRVDGSAVRSHLTRVGRDFLEHAVGEGPAAALEVTPFSALAAVRAG